MTEHAMTPQEARDVERAVAVNEQAQAMMQVALNGLVKRKPELEGVTMRMDRERCVWIEPEPEPEPEGGE